MSTEKWVDYTDQAAVAAVAADESNGWEWAVVEIFGHRKHAGRCREEERFGAKMLRVDIPTKDAAGVVSWETHFYGGASIFSYTLTDEASVMLANRPYERPSPYQLERPERFDGMIDQRQHYDDEPS